MRTYPGVRPSQFRDPGERAQIKVIDDMLWQVTGALTNSIFAGQTPVANTTPPPSPGPPATLVPHDHTTLLVGGQLHESALSLSDLTTNNVTIGRHGFAPKAPNDAAQFLDGTGAFDTLKETDIVDGTLLARVADNEAITGSWEFNDGTGSGTERVRILSPDPATGYNGVGLVVWDGTYNTEVVQNLGATGDGVCILPNCSGVEMVLVGNSDVGTMTNKTLDTNTNLKFTSSSNSRCAFQDGTAPTKEVTLNLSGISSSTTRIWAASDISGTIPLVGNDPPAVAAGFLGKVDLTAQAAAIGATNLSNTPPAGLYRVDVYAVCTTAQAGITLDVNIAWTDTLGATNRNVTAEPGSTIFPLALTTTGRASASLLCQVASGDIAYSTVCAGLTTGRYALYIRVMALG